MSPYIKVGVLRYRPFAFPLQQQPNARHQWVYRDAQRLVKNGALVALLVALCSWPKGLLVWLLVRGKPKREKRQTMSIEKQVLRLEESFATLT